ncbi:MAG: choice-of-anchor Q domain-containing protein [Chloroflexota bacterium]
MRTIIFNKFLTAIAIIAMLLVVLPVAPASAASISVNVTNDENTNNASCSLREAIIAANNNASYNGCVYSGPGPDDVITLTSGLTYTLSIVGSNEFQGDLDVGNLGGTSGNLTIQASGATNAIVDANDINRVFEVTSPGDINLTLIHITVTNGNNADGAGIFFDGAGTLTLTNSTVSSNAGTGSGDCGAGIYNNSSANINIVNSTIEGNSCATAGADGAGLFKGTGGTLTITNSTFNNNSTADNGAGVHVDMAAGTATITNSTFANNIAGGRGGGLQVGNGTVTVEFSTFSANAANMVSTSTGAAIQASGGSVSVLRSILANSTDMATGKDCDQLFPGTVSVTNSLVENNNDCTGSVTSTLDPGLGTLGNNDGPTLTMAITSASPAYNAALSCASITKDQRNIARPQSSACDLGAFELQVATFADVPLTHMFSNYIEAFYDAGITTGCAVNPLRYCPDANVTRGEMAVFIERAMGNFAPTPNPTGMFADVPYPGQPPSFKAFIEEFYNDGITTGCAANPLRYCPQNYVTRAEMAVFIERALGNFAPTPNPTGMFADVPYPGQPAAFTAFIEEFYNDGITTGCATNPLRYCPQDNVTRAEMAVFIVRAFGIPLP